MTLSATEFISGYLEHGQAYDKAARRERYLRTRQLKGRQPGRGDDAPSGDRPSSRTPPRISNRPKTDAATAARVAALEARLDKLKAHLSELVAAAKKRSGVEPPKTKESSKKTAGSTKKGGKSDLTTAEKAEKAKKARDEYEKEKKPDKDSGPTIEELRKQIADIQAQIRAAIAEARTKSSTKTASKGR